MSHVKISTYNFTTPGHDKSIAYGSGGTAKSLCNRAVLSGKDVVSVKNMMSLLGESDTKMNQFVINTEDIEKIYQIIDTALANLCKRDSTIEKNTVSIPETMKTYQLIWTNQKKNMLFKNSLIC